MELVNLPVSPFASTRDGIEFNIGEQIFLAGLPRLDSGNRDAAVRRFCADNHQAGSRGFLHGNAGRNRKGTILAIDRVDLLSLRRSLGRSLFAHKCPLHVYCDAYRIHDQ